MTGQARRGGGRGFAAFLVAQFLGAFNDNFFKFAILGFVAAAFAEDRNTYEMLAQALFALPFVLFASWAGQLADKFSKSTIIVAMSALEIGVMLIGLVGFATGNLALLFVALGMMSLQSTVFGPAKYGWMAEVFDASSLTRVNGIVNMTIFGAVVFGQLAGYPMHETSSGAMGSAAIWFVVVAACGLVASLFVTRLPASRPDITVGLDPRPELAAAWRIVRGDRTLLYTVLGIGHFYMLAALLQLMLLNYGDRVLGLSAVGTSWLVPTSLVGIAIGSLLAARWSERRIELGLVPLGASAMSLSILLLASIDAPRAPIGWHPLSLAPVISAFICVFGIGLAGGLFIVPLNTTLQYRAPADGKGRLLAFGNLVTFVGVFLSAGLHWLLGDGGLGLSVPVAFAFVAGLSLLGTVVSLWLLPEAFVRFCGWLLAHTVYRIRVHGLERLPERGGALIIANHVSWVDALVLSAAMPRRLRFLMYRDYYEWAPTHGFFRMMRSIPVAAGDPPDVIAASLRAAGEVLEQGHVVCIFAEGSITRTGNMLPFRRGFTTVIEGRDVPIIPVHLEGLWGSIFSHQGGKLLWKLPRRLPYPVTVAVGEAVGSEAAPWEVRQAIQATSVTARSWHREHDDSVVRRLLRRRGIRRRRLAWDDHGAGPDLAALVGRALSWRGVLAQGWGDATHVRLDGTGVDGVTALLAVSLDGRIPVVGPVRADERPLPGEIVLRPRDLEALSRRSGRGWRVAGAFLPRWLYQWLAWRRREGEVAFVVRGPDGDLPVTHASVLGVGSAVRDVHELQPDDVLGVLGSEARASWWLLGTWLPLVVRAGTARLDAEMEVADLASAIERLRITVLVAERAALQRLLDGARSDRLGGVKAVVVLDPPPDPEWARDIEERFGIEPVWAWVHPALGLLALNTPDVRGHGLFQRGAVRGSMGHPLPGVAVAVLDDDGLPLSPGQVGHLVVRASWLDNGTTWQQTGESGLLDDEGFVHVA